MSRRAQIYLGVVEAVVTHDDVALPDDELPVVYVVSVGETSIEAAVQADVADALHDVADVRFADERAEAVVDDEEQEMPVRDAGILVAIGTVADEGTPVDVEIEIYRSVSDSSRWVLTFSWRSSAWTVTSSSEVPVESS